MIDAGTPTAETEIVALEKELDEAREALATEDCTTACRALASIRRAADRICVLDPDSSRCADARAKAESARRRVRDACPDCAGAATREDEERERRAATKTGAGAASPAPPAEAPRGGCAGCSTTRGGSGGDFGLLVFGLWIVCRSSRNKVSRRV